MANKEYFKYFAEYYDFEKLLNDNFQQTSFNNLINGDIVKTTTMTYSQKYLLYDDYKDYNTTKMGVLIYKNNDDPSNSILYMYNYDTNNFIESKLYSDPGTSGCFFIEKYNNI